MFFSKPKLYIYRKRNSIEIYEGKNANQLAKIDIPKDVEGDQEILNLAKFQNILDDSLKNYLSKGQKATILLSDEIIFQKTIPRTDTDHQDDKIKSFLEDVPFDVPKIEKKQIETKDGLILVATNRDLFDPIVKSLNQIGASAQMVLPVSVFTSQKTVSAELFADIGKNSDLAKRSNLLIKQKGDKVTTKKEVSNGQKSQKLLAVVAIALLIAGLGGIIYYVITQFVVKKPKPVLPAYTQPETTIIDAQEATDSPQPSLEGTTSPLDK